MWRKTGKTWRTVIFDVTDPNGFCFWSGRVCANILEHWPRCFSQVWHCFWWVWFCNKIFFGFRFVSFFISAFWGKGYMKMEEGSVNYVSSILQQSKTILILPLWCCLFECFPLCSRLHWWRSRDGVSGWCSKWHQCHADLWCVGHPCGRRPVGMVPKWLKHESASASVRYFFLRLLDSWWGL